MRRQTALLVASVSFAAAGVACSTILGIEDLPLHTETDAQSDASVDVQSDTTCSPDLLQGCAASCPHAFCDDFDMDGQAPQTKWPGADGLGSPLFKGDASVIIGDAGRSPPSSLYAVSNGKLHASTYGFLVRQVQRDSPPGILSFAFDVNLETVRLVEARGPVPDAGSASIAAIVRARTFPPAGIAVLVSDDGVRLAVSDDIVTGAAPTSLDFIWRGNLNEFTHNWVRTEVVVTTADRAVALGYDACKSRTGPVAVGAIAAFGQTAACVPLTAGLVDLSWTASPGLLAGTLLFGGGNVAVRLDNVTADLLP